MKRSIVAGLATLLSMPTWQAHAANDTERTVAAFRQCGGLSESTQRLACFDGALKALEDELAEGEKREKQRNQENYGLSAHAVESKELASSPEQTTSAQSEAFKGISSTIAEVFLQQIGNRFVFVLANGQIWKQTQVSSFKGTPKPGQAVTISDGAIGGYRLKIESKSGIIGVQRIK